MKPGPAILVIDDELGPRESIRMVFQEDYKVHLAEDGEKGLKFLREEEIDVIILDIRMPRLDGIEVLKRIKKENPAIPIILLTGYGSFTSTQEATEAGAFAYLVKPFDVDHLREVVKSALKENRGSGKV